VLEAPPKCSEHKLALELVRVEISQFKEIAKHKVVTDVYRRLHPWCNTEHFSPQGAVRWSLEGRRRWNALHC
jgi:hypothetical protein